MFCRTVIFPSPSSDTCPREGKQYVSSKSVQIPVIPYGRRFQKAVFLMVAGSRRLYSLWSQVPEGCIPYGRRSQKAVFLMVAGSRRLYSLWSKVPEGCIPYGRRSQKAVFFTLARATCGN